jgi:hypothetical protein
MVAFLRPLRPAGANATITAEQFPGAGRRLDMPSRHAFSIVPVRGGRAQYVALRGSRAGAGGRWFQGYWQNLGATIMATKKKVVKSTKLAPAKKKARSKKGVQEGLIANMETWRKIENASVASTGRVMTKTENPIVRLVMEIIQRDSQMHYHVQGWIADSLKGKAVTLTPDEIGGVWGLIEDHIRLEQKTVELAKEAIDLIGSSKGMQVQSYLLEYLLEDEEKHNKLLERLEAIQKGMYPYG